MSEHLGEKTEQATPRRLEEALKKGQFPRSSEVQTVFVLMAAMLAIFFTGEDLWRQLTFSLTGILGHLHDLPLTVDALPGHFVKAVLVFANAVWPVVLAAMIGGLLAGGMQSRFQTASEALTPDWKRVNPIAGLKNLFSMRSAPPSGAAEPARLCAKCWPKCPRPTWWSPIRSIWPSRCVMTARRCARRRW